MPDSWVVVGLDNGGTCNNATVLDAVSGKFLVDRLVETPSRVTEGPDVAVESLAEALDGILANTGVDRARVRAVGLDTPGPASADGVISSKGATSDWVQVTSGVVVTRPATPVVTVTPGPDVDCVTMTVQLGSNGGAPVLETQYRLQLTDPWVTVQPSQTSSTPWCDKNQPATPDLVTLEVRQRNAAGDAAWSTGTGSALTLAPRVPAPRTGTLDAVAGG